ncbi:MAG TPA: radical SAM protein, partial [Clostridia bacterium]
RCKMCGYREPIANEEGLKKEDVFTLLGDAKELGLQSIAFSGGEVLLRKDIYEIILYAKELQVEEITVVTNGTLVNEENAQKLVESGMTNVNISLEGIGEMNDYIRGEGTFNKIVNAINIFKKYEDMIKTTVNVVISKHNYQHILALTKFIYEELGVSYITYSPLNTSMMGSNFALYSDKLVIRPEDIPSVKEEIEKVIVYTREKTGYFVPESYLRRIPDYFEGKNIIPQKPCFVPSESCGIDSAGNVFPCWVEYRTAGNITKESLKAIVANEIYLSQCKAALSQKCKGCLVSCYPSIHEDNAREISDAV